MTEPRLDLASPAVNWQGINHLALITTDMDATVRFWHGVLGADLVATVRTETFLHYFFRIGSTCSVAFFQYTENPGDKLMKPAGVYDKRACQFDHLAMNVADESELEKLRQRLLESGSEVTEIVDHHIMRSVYFTDPNGIALEASWWVHDPTEAEPDFDNVDYFADPDPVPSVRELIAGELQSVPRTQLA